MANDLCPYTCVVPNCPTPYILFVTQDEWNNHVINDHPPHWQCPCCGGDPPIFESLSGITHHLMTVHSDQVEADLEEFLSDAEISIMGITNCPLCDSEGPPDSPGLMEHILQHVHDFSLRSLPWPADLTIPLQKSVDLFDTHHAVKITKDDKGNEYIFDMAEWAETVNPTFDQSRGVLVCYDSEGKELILEVASLLEVAKTQVSLRLQDLARNQPKGEDESTQQSPSNRDYFSQRGNDYFKDESSDGRFPSQTSHSSQQTQNTVRSSGKHQPMKLDMQEKWSLCLQTLEGHSNSVFSVAFSPDSTRLASGSRDDTVKIWDASSGACLQTLEGHSDWVNSVAFSPESTRLASGSDDDTVKIWDRFKFRQ